MSSDNTPSVSNLTAGMTRDPDLMTPLHLVILIDAVTHGNGYRATSSVAAEYAEQLCRLGAIKVNPPYYVTTIAGKVWLNKILKTPFTPLSEIPHGSGR